MILVSVIIPTYNRAATIEASIRSVLEQSVQETEVIIVDDCSADNTEAVITGIRDERIRYVKNAMNMGAAKSRNIGAAGAQGKYLAFNDSDDIWQHDKLEKQLRYLEDRPEIRMVYCALNLHMGNKTQTIPDTGLPLEGHILATLIQGNTVGTPTILIEREFFLNIGGFDESILALEDWEFALRVSQNEKIGYVNECLVDAYSDDAGVNANGINAMKAQISIMQRYAASKKELCRNNILFLMERIANEAGSESLYEYKDYFVSLFFSTEYEYYLCCDAVNKILKFKNNYNLLADFLENDQLKEHLEKVFQKKNWKNVVVYGAGRIGKIVADIIGKTDVNLQYMIDKNITGCNFGEIQSVDSLDERIDAVIVTVKENYSDIVSLIREKYDGEICFIGDLL